MLFLNYRSQRILKMKKQIFSLILPLAVFTPMTHAQNVETFKPTFPQFSNTQTQRNKSNQLYAIGQATFSNQVKIPAYGVTVENPVEDGLLKNTAPCTKSNCTFNFKLNAKDAEKLKLVAVPSIGYMLIPRQWTNISAAAGANGTGSVLMMSPNQKEAITAYDSSFCVGCGLPNATLYFPDLLKQSLENEYGGYKDLNKKLKLVYPSKTTAFFSYQIPNLNNKTHGIAKCRDDGDFNFVDMHITLDKANQNLATPILNFYNATH